MMAVPKTTEAGEKEIYAILRRAQGYYAEMAYCRKVILRGEKTIRTLNRNMQVIRTHVAIASSLWVPEPYDEKIAQRMIAALNDQSTRIRQQMREATRQRARAEAMISLLPDTERQIMELRWLQSRRWYYIENAVHISQRHCLRLQRKSVSLMSKMTAVPQVEATDLLTAQMPPEEMWK